MDSGGGPIVADDYATQYAGDAGEHFEYINLLNSAWKNHTTPALSPFPEFEMQVTFDTGCKLPHPFNCEIKPNVSYLLKRPAEDTAAIKCELWEPIVDMGDTLDELDRKIAEGKGREVIDENGDTVTVIEEAEGVILVTVSPIELDTDPPRRLTFGEALAWLAAEVLGRAGDEDKALGVLRYVYPNAPIKLRKHEQLPVVNTASVDNVDFPVDKINSNVWGMLEDAPSGQYGMTTADALELDIRTTSERDKLAGKEDVLVTFCIDFSALEDVTISKKLEPYDKRVYVAAAACYNTIGPYFTYQQLYRAMGFKGRAGKQDKEKLDESLTKMATARITIDNTDEARRYNYDKFVYDGMLLPMERVRAMVGGKVTEAVIHPFRELPMLTFARQRKQITTIPVNVLDSPLSMTPENLRLEDYFIERISKMKRKGSKTSKRMLFETVFEKVGIHTRKQRQRALGKINKLLEHYKTCRFIDGYQLDERGITIIFKRGEIESGKV